MNLIMENYQGLKKERQSQFLLTKAKTLYLTKGQKIQQSVLFWAENIFRLGGSVNAPDSLLEFR